MSEQKQNLQKIKEFVELMKANDLVEIEIVDGDSKIHLKRPGPAETVVTQIPMPHSQQVTLPQQIQDQPEPKQEPESDLIEIKSPIVGTFYSGPSPDSEAFVTIDSKVNPDTTICIIEAMKVMNEIKAEISGTIVEILCRPGEAVEYGQPIFKVRLD